MRRDRASVLIRIFQENYDNLLRFLTRRMGGDAQRAADIAQDTYLRLAAAPVSDGKIDNPRAYVYRVAGNLAIDWMRREKRHFASSQSDAGQVPEQVEDPKPSPEMTVMGRQQLALIDRALDRLPENPRRALLMFRMDGFSHARIAQELGVSESMVAKYIARALQQCRDELWRADQNK
ncbi:RNA polymerase sigma factor [Thalassospira sp. TSL5-1]|uniref:RNA polymerase sigma factor n=1 Tax=Thalassospira sp. TSL5-1 TaxID=1544451 RepID=UPI000938CA75|nr:RNA polymerase sigma factor [Thalassospira sp. TSL5-1]OKH88243.1 ECF family RNA polymerase sigma factor [Thalassospira sp. TSL5-1]